MIAIAAAALVGSLYFLAYTVIEKTPEVTIIEYQEVFYECTHTPGNMECVSLDDSDVGFGKIDN
jgi:hypothetical protein